MRFLRAVFAKHVLPTYASVSAQWNHTQNSSLSAKAWGFTDYLLCRRKTSVQLRSAKKLKSKEIMLRYQSLNEAEKLPLSVRSNESIPYDAVLSFASLRCPCSPFAPARLPVNRKGLRAVQPTTNRSHCLHCFVDAKEAQNLGEGRSLATMEKFATSMHKHLEQKYGRKDWWKAPGAIVPTPLLFHYCIQRCNGHSDLFTWCRERILADEDVQYFVLRCEHNCLQDIKVDCPLHGEVLKGRALEMLQKIGSPVGFCLKGASGESLPVDNTEDQIPIRWFLKKLNEAIAEVRIKSQHKPDKVERDLFEHIQASDSNAFKFPFVDLVWYTWSVRVQCGQRIQGGLSVPYEIILAKWWKELMEGRNVAVANTLGLTKCACTQG